MRVLALEHRQGSGCPDGSWDFSECTRQMDVGGGRAKLVSHRQYGSGPRLVVVGSRRYHPVMQGTSDWRVLFIGGPTVAGKSTLATQLGRHFGVSVIEVDWFSKVLERALPPSHNPGFQLLGDDNVSQLPTPELARRLLKYSEFVCDAIEVVVAERLSSKRPAIIEGAWLSPAFVRKKSYATGQRRPSRIRSGPSICRSLFLVEPELGEMEQRLEERYYKGWLASNPGNAALSHFCGLETARQAKALHLPVLTCRPFDTLLDRALAALL